MDEKLFSDLVDSLKEVEDHVKGKKQLKTTSLNVVELPVFTADKIKSIRKQMLLTQQSFADVLGVSLRTVESWEEGYSKPNGPSRRLLSLLEEEKMAEEVSNRIIKIG